MSSLISVTFSVSRAESQSALQVGRELAHLFSLPLAKVRRRNLSGPHRGSAAGSSIELFDHREYHPGDDIRHIDWRVTARGQRPVIRLFEQETAPRVEILLDTSASMRISPEKWRVALACVAFIIEAALMDCVRARLFIPGNRAPRELCYEEFGNGWEADGSVSFPTGPVPWSPASLRFVISDLLFPHPPLDVLRAWQGAGILLLLVPAAPEEMAPPWEHIDLVEDCETGDRRELRTGKNTRDQYRRAYDLHFAGWSECVRTRRGGLLIVRTDQPLSAVLAGAQSPFPMR